MFAVSMIAFCFAGYIGLEKYLDRILRNALRYDGRAIAQTILEAGSDAPERISAEIERHNYNSRFIRIESPGGLIYVSKAPREDSFDPRRIRDAARWDEYSRDEASAGPKAMMVYAFPYMTGDGRRYLIETGNTYTKTRQTLRGLLLVVLAGAPLATILAMIGGWMAIGRALFPVREITKEAQRISWQRRDERLPVPRTGDEIEQLSLTLNSMLERLEESFQRMQRFSADVSHELRTPLTIIRGELESIVRQVQCSPQVLDALGSSLEEVDRLTRIVEQLLTLCRLDGGQDTAPSSVVDLGELAKSTAEQMRLLCVEKDLALKLSIAPGVQVLGAPARLKQIVVNLLDNAIKHSEAHGQIEIAVRIQGDRACLAVNDNGTGVAAEALPHLFDRFYRADSARSRESGGVGLGLSIVKAIVGSHGGTVAIQSEEGNGTSVSVELPSVPSSIS